jgi:hypothetical protein
MLMPPILNRGPEDGTSSLIGVPSEHLCPFLLLADTSLWSKDGIDGLVTHKNKSLQFLAFLVQAFTPGF